jgi:large subunit ribosomal protein L24
MANKFKKNDQVIVISGSDKGKVGKIISLTEKAVVVEGVNLATVHKKPTNSTAGQIIKVEKSIHISNISHVEDGRPTKIKFVIEAGNGKNFTKKNRISKKSGKKIV